MSNEELKPCPCCGGPSGAWHYASSRGGPDYAVGCKACGISTAWMKDGASAIAAWNLRAAPPVAAPGASIAEDNVFVHALSALTKSSVLVPWTPEEQAFIDCVDAKLAQHGYQQFEEGLMTAEKTLKSNGKAMEAALNDAAKEKSRADAAEASLARLVEGVTSLVKLWDAEHISPEDYNDEMHRVEGALRALLPAKADKPTEGGDHA